MKPTKNISYLKIDRLLWGMAYLLIALSFVFFANNNSFQELLRIPSFYSDIVVSFALTFLVALYLMKLKAKLDVRYSWYSAFKVRLIKQFVYGVMLPLVFAITVEVVYLKAIDIDFSDSSILNLELPLTFIFLVLINITSFAIDSYNKTQIETTTAIEKEPVEMLKSVKFITINRGFIEENLPIEKCALIMSSNKLIWLLTFEGEKFRLSGTLEEWEEKLKHSQFYRINRQYLSSFNAIHSVELTKTRKLKVNFVLPTEDVYISKPNVSKFRQWWTQ